MTAPDLLPCPFCGEAPRMWEYKAGECEIECVNGHCPSEPHVGMPTKAEAISAWNTRTTPLAEAMAVLRTIVDSYEATSELHTSAEDLAANLYDHAWAFLAKHGDAK